MAKRGMRGAVLAVAALVLVIFAFMFFYPKKISNELPKAVAIDTGGQPRIGNPNANLHFVVFEDLKCFNCMRYETTLFPKIKKKYIDTGKADYTLINLAFIDGSMPAANAARCAYAQSPELFFAFVDHVFNHQPPENEDWATIPTLMNFASQVPGLNKEKFSECLVQSPYTDLINNNLQIAATAMEGSSVATPSLYINGIKVEPLTLERVDTLVNQIQTQQQG